MSAMGWPVDPDEFTEWARQYGGDVALGPYGEGRDDRVIRAGFGDHHIFIEWKPDRGLSCVGAGTDDELITVEIFSPDAVELEDGYVAVRQGEHEDDPKVGSWLEFHAK